MLQGFRLRKRSLLSALCFVTLVYAAVQFYVQDEYSPLQLLSTVESEAGRLRRFISQPQVTCNESLATGNLSRWVICLDPEIGFPSLRSEDQKAIVYSIGPQQDFSFEQVVSWNLSSVKLYVFSHQGSQLKETINTNPSKTSFYSSGIVPNDPSDFARNSFDSQTLNNVMESLQHDHVDLLKLDSFVEMVQTLDVLRFAIQDSLLQSVKELHFVIRLDKLEEDFIYSWYRVLYSLFNTAGFRLYHTSASDALCLQDTVMESCTYFLSWVKKPAPQVFVLYPPAIDGSYEHEEDRILNYLHTAKSKQVSLTPWVFQFGSKNQDAIVNTNTLSIGVSSDFLEKITKSCNIVIISSSSKFLSGSGTIQGCRTKYFSFSIQRDRSVEFILESFKHDKATVDASTKLKDALTSAEKSLLILDIGDHWEVLDVLASGRLLQDLNELVLFGQIFPPSERGAQTVVRNRYSQLRRLEEFSLSLVRAGEMEDEDLKFISSTETDIYSMNFVRKENA